MADEIGGLPGARETQAIKISRGHEKKVREFIEQFILEFRKQNKGLIRYVLKTKKSFSGKSPDITARDVSKAESKLKRLLKIEITRNFTLKLDKSKTTAAGKFLIKLFSNNSDIAVRFVNMFADNLYNDVKDKKISANLAEYILNDANKNISVALKEPAGGGLGKLKKILMQEVKLFTVKPLLKLPKYGEFECYMRGILLEIKNDMEARSFTSVKQKEKKCLEIINLILRREFKKNANLSNLLKYVLKNKEIKRTFISSILQGVSRVSDEWVGEMSTDLPKKMLKGIPEYKSLFIKDSMGKLETGKLRGFKTTDSPAGKVRKKLLKNGRGKPSAEAVEKELLRSGKKVLNLIEKLFEKISKPKLWPRWLR